MEASQRYGARTTSKTENFDISSQVGKEDEVDQEATRAELEEHRKAADLFKKYGNEVPQDIKNNIEHLEKILQDASDKDIPKVPEEPSENSLKTNFEKSQEEN